MSRTKTKYASKNSEKPAEFLADQGPKPSADAAAVAGDEATVRLKRTLEGLRQSEELQRLAAFARHQAAQQGFQPGTAAHQQVTRQIFDNHLAHLQGQAEAATPATEPEPGLFRPSPEPRDESAKYSAPVSRGDIGSYSRNRSPSSIRLSPQQREAAALAGISEVEYARQFQKLGQYKKERGVERE